MFIKKSKYNLTIVNSVSKKLTNCVDKIDTTLEKI